MEADRQRMPFVAPVRAFNLIWVVVLAAGWAAGLVWGTPHLRVSWEASARGDSPHYLLCRYRGVSTFQVRPRDGHCPLILLSRVRKG